MIGSFFYRTQDLQRYCNTVRLTNAQRLAFWSGFILVWVGCEGSGANSSADVDIDGKAQKKREKFFLDLHFFRKNSFAFLSSYIFPNTLIIPLTSLWTPSSWATTSLRFCAYFIEKDCSFCISLKLFPIFWIQNETGGSFSAFQS